MSKYATEQKFGGQRASVGRVILYGVARSDTNAHFVDGTISAIRDDVPTIRYNTPSGSYFTNKATYFDARTENEVELMAPGSWCWPPLV